MTESGALESAREGGGLLALARNFGRFLLRLPRALAPLPVGLWAAGLWILSSGSLPDVPFGPRGYVGNLAHAGAFGLLGMLCLLGLPRRRGWFVLGPLGGWLIAAGVVAYGIVDELHQSTVPGRDASLADIGTDAVGVACVLWIAGYVSRADATRDGLGRRILVALAACLAMAQFSTVVMRNAGPGTWW